MNQFAMEQRRPFFFPCAVDLLVDDGTVDGTRTWYIQYTPTVLYRGKIRYFSETEFGQLIFSYTALTHFK